MIKVIGCTTREISQSHGVSERHVRRWAKTYKWQVVATLGRTKVYSEADVASFFQARLRRELLRQAGWSDGRQGQGLVWDDSFDCECPKCGAMAVERPARTPEEAQEVPPIYCKNCGLVR